MILMRNILGRHCIEEATVLPSKYFQNMESVVFPGNSSNVTISTHDLIIHYKKKYPIVNQYGNNISIWESFKQKRYCPKNDNPLKPEGMIART